MRERITINSSSGYSVTSSGQIDASGATTSEIYATVTKGITRQDLNLDQNLIENGYTFTIRADTTITKDDTITWRSNLYSIIAISNQVGYQKFTEIVASYVE